MPANPKRRKLTRWIVAAVAVVVVIVVGGPFVYFHFIQSDPPPKLSLDTTPVPSSVAGTARAPLAGTWKIATGSLVRYRVTETLFGQSGSAVGTTKSVTGSLTIAGTKVTAATFSVDMTSLTSDENTRDDQFQHRIMDTADFPTATFVLTKPISFAPIPNNGVIKSYPATGKLTLHGTTKSVTIPLTAKRTGNVIQVQGILTITFGDYGVNNPSGGPAQVGNSGQMEFLLNLEPS